jgi:hypothetical protein
MPGCVVSIKKMLKLLTKGFQGFTYDKLTPVTSSTVYDLASVTKIMLLHFERNETL